MVGGVGNHLASRDTCLVNSACEGEQMELQCWTILTHNLNINGEAFNTRRITWLRVWDGRIVSGALAQSPVQG